MCAESLHMKPRILQDESRLSGYMQDLLKVRNSSELRDSMFKHKQTIKDVIKRFDATTKVENATIEMKKKGIQTSQEEMKPVLEDLKEALRRIKGAGLKPSKGCDTDTAPER